MEVVSVPMNSSSATVLWSFLSALLIWIIIRVWYKLTSGQCAFEESLKGKVFLVTGCTSGIGYETAKELYGHDATVVMLIRNVKKGLECMQQIRTIYPHSKGEIRIVPVDLSSLRNVRLCARMINNTEPVINVLVNNAAIGSKEGHKASLTSDRLEEVMASNYFGHFLLTMLLLPRLRATKGTRIINISSLVHSLHGHLPTDSLNFEKEYYDGFNAYIRSKLAIVIMSRHLSRLVSVHDAAFFSCNPGILATQLSKYFIRKFFGKRLGDLLYPFAMFVNKLVAKTTHEGAQTTLSLCVQKGVEQHNGKYFSDCRPARNSPLADDVELGRRLFRETVRLVGLRETALHTQLNTTSSPLDASEFCGTRLYDDRRISNEDSDEDSRSESEQDIDKRKLFDRQMRELGACECP